MNISSIDIQLTKKELDRYTFIPKETTSRLDKHFRLEFIYSANMLEGSTLSKAETAFVIEKGVAIGGKTLKEQNNAVSYAQAVDWISSSANLSKFNITENVLLSLHHLPSVSKPSGNSVIKYSFQVPYVLSEYIEWLHLFQGNPIETAVTAHNKLIAIRPFPENTPKTARLLMNLLLIQNGYPLAYISPAEKERYVVSVAEVEKGNSGEQLTQLLFGAIARSVNSYLTALKAQRRQPTQKLLKIGELATLTNETIPTLRHWTKQGLLTVAEYTAGGYQLYESSMAEVVIKIRELQRSERRTVKEIKKLLL